jgi:hypothetical protein
MTVEVFAKQLFKGDMKVEVSEADIISLCLANNLNASDEVTKDNYTSVMKAIVNEIPGMLARPQSIGENGYSVSRATRQDIIDWYSVQCKRFDVRNELAPRVTIMYM